MLVVEAVDRLGQFAGEAGHVGGLVFLGGQFDRLGELVYQAQHRLALRVVKRLKVRRGGSFPRLPQHAAQPGVGVHHVGAGLAVKVERLVPGEVYVLYPAVEQGKEDDRAYAYLPGDSASVFQLGALLRDYAFRLLHRLGEQVLQIHYAAFPRGKRLAAEGDHAEIHVLAALRPVPAQQLAHLEQLLEMQVLLVGHHVQVLVEIVGLVAVFYGRQVPGHVQRGAVAAHDDGGRHVPLVQLDYPGARVLDQKPLFGKLVYHGLHLVDVKAFPGVGIELHPQHVVHLFGVLKGDFLEPSEYLKGFFVPVLYLFEPGAALVFQRWVVLCLGVEAHIELHHLVHAAPADGLFVAPALVGGDHLAELGAPVPQMVHAHALVAQEAVYPVQGAAYHGGGQVAYVEALGDVY